MPKISQTITDHAFDREALAVRLNTLIDSLRGTPGPLKGGGKGSKGGGVQRLASLLGVSPNILHYWRRTEARSAVTGTAVKNIRPKDKQAIQLARIAMQYEKPSHPIQDECKNWLQLCGRWKGEEEGTKFIEEQLKLHANLLVSAEAVYNEIRGQLLEARLDENRAISGVAAYFGQTTLQECLNLWWPPQRHLEIFWGARSPASPIISDTKSKKVMHDFFQRFLQPKRRQGEGIFAGQQTAPEQGVSTFTKPGDETSTNQAKRSESICTGIDVFVSGQTGSDRFKLREYLDVYYRPSQDNEPGIRFFEADPRTWDELNIEHLVDAWVFHGEDSLSDLRDFMFLVGESDSTTLLKLSESPNSMFANPFIFSSQLMRLNWACALEYLSKRQVTHHFGKLDASKKLWQVVVLNKHEYWTLKNSHT